MSQKRDFFDFDKKIYKPIWFKALILLGTLGWGTMELMSGKAFWAMIFLGVGVICVWGFFLRKPSNGESV